MVKITELAAQKVKEIQKVKNKENAFLRIHIINEGCSGPNFGMTLEESITEDDMLYKEYGVSIIADIGLATALEGVIVDYTEVLKYAKKIWAMPEAVVGVVEIADVVANK
jgi:iron-sulfur cluster assembly protein